MRGSVREIESAINFSHGFAWGGDVVGWVAFSNAAAPRILSITATGADAAEVKWVNPVEYKKLDIFIWKPKDY